MTNTEEPASSTPELAAPEPPAAPEDDEAAPVSSTALVIHSSAQPTLKSSKPFKPRIGFGSAFEDTIIMGGNEAAGLVGLGNLGNTCYMNSSLQCLLHTVPLMRSFLTGRYKADLNRTNPLGQKGELAESFAALMASLWKPGVQSVTPRSFKAKIGRFCPVFAGYGQQDSQELLAFLLDGLHEDVNRIKDKPYSEDAKEGEQVPDDEAAAQQWASHRSRNDSLIVDHCLGLYRSTLVCPACSHSSRKFDPVMYLSLPLPESKQRSFTVTLIHVDGSQRPTKYSVVVPSVGTVKDLLYALAQTAGMEVAAPSVASSRVTSVACSLDALGAASGAGGAGGAGAGSLPPSGSESALVRPQDVLLLARVSQTSLNESVEVFADPKTRVSEVVPNEHRTYNPEFLVCYRYPSPEWGPGNKELKQVVVHHSRRKAGTQYGAKTFGAPLLLLLPESIAVLSPEQLSQGGSSYNTEYAVREDAGVVQYIRYALLPFLVKVEPGTEGGSACEQPAEEGGEAGIEDAAEAGSGAGEVDAEEMQTCSREEVQAAVEGDGLSAAGQAQAGEGDREGDGDSVSGCRTRAMADAGGSSSEAEAEAGISSSQQLEQQLEHGAVAEAAEAGPSESSVQAGLGGRGSVEMDGGAGAADAGREEGGGSMDWEACVSAATAPATACNVDKSPRHSWTGAGARPGLGPVLEPFDMWAQQDAAADPDSPAGGPRVTEAEERKDPFVVHVSKSDRMDSGFNQGYSMSEVCETLAFLVHWPMAAAAAPQYDLEAMESPALHESFVRAEEQARQGRQPVQLSACFEAFLQPEQLSEDDSWYCPRCKAHVQADKKLDLWHLPEVLVVHLKRFCYTRSLREKISTHVDFPLEGLDLSRFLLRPQGEEPVYDCYAVSNHFGSLGGGHYTAFCKMPETGKWFCFDDSHVSPVEPEAVMSSAAYVLFYRRRGEAAKDPEDLLQQMFEEQAKQESDAADAASTRDHPDQNPDEEDQDLESASGRRVPLAGRGPRSSLDGAGPVFGPAAEVQAGDGQLNIIGAGYRMLAGSQPSGSGRRSYGGEENDLHGAVDSWKADSHPDAMVDDDGYDFIQAGAGGSRPAPNSPALSDVIRQPGSDEDDAVEILALDDDECSGQDIPLMSTSP